MIPGETSNTYSRYTTLSLFRSNVLSVLLHRSDWWRMTKKDNRRLATFHTTCLRIIMREFWPKISPMQNTTNQRAGKNGHYLKKNVEMDELYAENGAHSVCKNCTDIDSRGAEEKGCTRTTWRRRIIWRRGMKLKN